MILLVTSSPVLVLLIPNTRRCNQWSWKYFSALIPSIRGVRSVCAAISSLRLMAAELNASAGSANHADTSSVANTLSQQQQANSVYTGILPAGWRAGWFCQQHAYRTYLLLVMLAGTTTAFYYDAANGCLTRLRRLLLFYQWLSYAGGGIAPVMSNYNQSGTGKDDWLAIPYRNETCWQQRPCLGGGRMVYKWYPQWCTYTTPNSRHTGYPTMHFIMDPINNCFASSAKVVVDKICFM